MDSPTQPSWPPAPKAWLLMAGKLALSLGMVWLVLRQIHLDSFRSALRTADVGLGVLSLMIYLVGLQVFETARLAAGATLLQEHRIRLPLWIMLFIESRAFFFLLPAGVGQEGYLWLRLRQHGWSHGRCAYLLLTIRITGLAFWSLGLALALRSPTFRQACSSLLVGPLGQPWAWLAVGAVLLAAPMVMPRFTKRFGELRWNRMSALPWAWFQIATGLATVTYALAFLAAARALGLPFTLGQAVGCLTLVFIGLALPISMAGLGLQEGILLLVGKGLGMAPAPLLGLSCLLHLQRLLPALLGLTVFLARRGRPSA